MSRRRVTMRKSELDCDYGLNYEHVIEAITAVSGYVDHSTGQVQRLIEKIKFTPPPAPVRQ